MAVTLRDAGAQSSRKVVESPRSTVPFQPAMRLVGADSPSEADVEADVVAEEFYVSEGWRQDVARAQEPMGGAAGASRPSSQPEDHANSTGAAGQRSNAAGGNVHQRRQSRPQQQQRADELPEMWAQVGVFLAGSQG